MYERVLVPLDGSDIAEAILPFVEKLAGPVDAEAMVVRVVEPLSAGEAFAAAGVAAADTLFLRQLEAKEYLARIERRLADKGIRVRTELRSGAPAAEIVAAAAAWNADLIAMATHGRSGLGRLLVGSVAETVLRAAPVPVLMIRTTTKLPAPVGEARR
jgi:nucleotide-binding universal stress UspA family protein